MLSLEIRCRRIIATVLRTLLIHDTRTVPMTTRAGLWPLMCVDYKYYNGCAISGGTCEIIIFRASHHEISRGDMLNAQLALCFQFTRIVAVNELEGESTDDFTELFFSLFITMLSLCASHALCSGDRLTSR